MVEAKNTLVDAFLGIRSKVARSVAGIVPQRDLEDVVQDTYLRIRELNNAQAIGCPESYIYRTARNLALDHVKRAASRLVDSHEDVESVADLLELAEDDSTFREVASGREFAEFCAAVQELPEQCRRVFVLRKVYGFSQKEIARSLSISESAVEKHVARGLKLIYLRLNSPQPPGRSGGAVVDIGTQRGKRATR